MTIDTATYTWISATLDLAAILLGWWLGHLVARFALRALLRLTRRTATEADDLLFEVLGKAAPWLGAALAAVLAIRIGPSTPGLVAFVDRGAKVALTLTATFALAEFLTRLIQLGELRLGDIGGAGATSLTRKLLHSVIVGVGCVIVLTELGVEITPLLAALGVGSLTVGLALQPTLTNAFAGITLSLMRRLRIGDFVRLDGGLEGQIVDIGSRSTEIRAPGDSIVLVPNAKLLEVVVTNFSLPAEDVACLIELGVAYGSDLDQVERVLLEVARDVLATVPGAAADFEPVVRFKGFGEWGLPVVCVLRARTYPDRLTLIHEFVRRVHARFAAERIEIAVPPRAAHIQPGGRPS